MFDSIFEQRGLSKLNIVTIFSKQQAGCIAENLGFLEQSHKGKYATCGVM
jgi:hypothetical protein